MNSFLLGEVTWVTLLQWFCTQELHTPLAVNLAALITSSSTPRDEDTLRRMVAEVVWRAPRTR